ncbi:hypothetical protein NDU88_005369 [Pleurodeles waltl]|uniref:Uncharacterized protein n=1 Tax=Pleurodeles waltl TaxID=8319 RepID=A0AAV7PK66_PLEWA|nr:hypothetical protein NDU88_005369 [Pleurodeles waltl]
MGLLITGNNLDKWNQYVWPDAMDFPLYHQSNKSRGRGPAADSNGRLNKVRCAPGWVEAGGGGTIAQLEPLLTHRSPLRECRAQSIESPVTRNGYSGRRQLMAGCGLESHTKPRPQFWSGTEDCSSVLRGWELLSSVARDSSQPASLY